MLIVGLVFGVTALWVRSIHTFSVMPDELGYVKQALQIARTGLPVGPHGFYFNSWGQLLPVISAPIFGGTDMVDAFYTAHTVYALLLASTAVPTYLLAREIELGPLAANLVAALSVAVPWLVLSGAVMTEDVAYPAFAWAMLAILRALRRPSPTRDIVALLAVALAFFARTQFIILGPILALSVIVHDVGLAWASREPAGTAAALRAGLRLSLSRHRVLWFACTLAAGGILATAITGSDASILGNYVTPAQGDILPSGTLSAGLEQLDGVILGIGAVPLTLATVWALATIVRPRHPTRHALAAMLVVSVPLLVVMLGSFQQRVLGGATTDRYLFYVVPLLFVGTAAWIVDRRGSWPGLVLTVSGVAWLVMVNTLHAADSFTIVNPSFNFHRVLVEQFGALGKAFGIANLDARIPIAIAVSALALLAMAVRQRVSTRLALVIILVPLLAYGAVSTGYSMRGLSRQDASIPASHPRELTWIDRAVPSGADVGLVLAPEGTPENTEYTWWQPNYWNKTVRHAFILPGGSSLAQGFVSVLSQDLGAGRLTGLDGAGYLVKLNTDARFGLRAPVVQQGAELTLYRVSSGARLAYGTWGVAPDGTLIPGMYPFIRIFGNGGSAHPGRVDLTVKSAPPPSDCPCRLLVGVRGPGTLLPRAFGLATVNITRHVTLPASGGRLDLPISVLGRTGRLSVASVILAAVHVT